MAPPPPDDRRGAAPPARAPPPAAAPPVARPAPPPRPGLPEAVTDHPEDAKTLRTLRLLRKEVQGLQQHFRDVREGRTSLQKEAAYVRKTLADMRALMRDVPADYESTRHIHNVWEKMSISPVLKAPEAAHDAEDLLRDLQRLDGYCEEVVYAIGESTIPPRLNAWLSRTVAGVHVPFHDVFKDELPREEHRQALLDGLARVPDALHHGMVDLSTGYVYRHWGKLRYNVLASLVMAGAVVGLFALLAWGRFVGLVRAVLPGKEALPDAALALAWAGLVAGIALHTLVGAAKRSRARGAAHPIVSPVLAPAWMASRVGVFLWKLALSVFSLAAYVALSPPDEVNALNGLLLGYSLDSVVELFTGVLDTRSARRVDALRKQLGDGSNSG